MSILIPLLGIRWIELHKALSDSLEEMQVLLAFRRFVKKKYDL